MFSKTIIDTDAFLDMPQTAQLLYFYLNMNADDDGFVGNPKRIMRSGGFNDDDMKVLLAKRFLLTFDSGVIVIKHWRMHNTIRKDRYIETTYIDEKRTLQIKDNKAYTEAKKDSGNHLATQYRIEEDRIEENSISFDRFWNLYDKKIGKPKSEKKWNSLSEKDKENILAYIPKYKLAQPEKRFRKNPETFLNNRSWEDEIISPRRTTINYDK